MLSNETFDSVDDDPKFADKDKVRMSTLPQKKAEIVPALKHEYDVETGAIIYEKVRQYNGTYGNSLSPLQIQGGYVDDVYSKAVRGFSIKEVKDISVFVGDPDIAAVEPMPMAFKSAQYMPFNAVRLGINQMPAATSLRVNNIETFPDVDVLVMDEMVLRSHPDLNMGGIGNNCYLPTGWVSCTIPQNIRQFHGTAVAGIIGAKDNLGGVVGAAPGVRIWSAVVCGLRISDNVEGCPVNNVIVWDHAAAVGIYEVINMSLGPICPIRSTNCSFPVGEVTLTAASNVNAAGITMVTSAGNDAADADGIFFCNIPSVICVSAMADSNGKCGGNGPSWGPTTFGGQSYTQRDDARAFFSNYGSTVDIMASGFPGLGYAQSLSTNPNPNGANGVPTTINTALPFIGASVHGSYGTLGGTSEASPWVAGAAAALKALHPSWTPAQIKTDLQTNAIAQNAPCNTATGLGGLATGANSASSEKILNLAAID
jgi:subtilisin family serine protease